MDNSLAVNARTVFHQRLLLVLKFVDLRTSLKAKQTQRQWSTLAGQTLLVPKKRIHIIHGERFECKSPFGRQKIPLILDEEFLWREEKQFFISPSPIAIRL